MSYNKDETISTVNRYVSTSTHAHDWKPTLMLRFMDGDLQQLHRCTCGGECWINVVRQKRTQCQKCNGYGFNTITEIHESVGVTYSKTCSVCGGKGFIEEDV